MAFDLGSWSNFLGAFPVLALGIFLLTVKPRQAAATWLAFVAIGIGGYALSLYGVTIVRPDAAAWVEEGLSGPFAALWAIAVIGLASTFPSPLAREDRWRVTGAAAVSLSIALAMLAPMGNMMVGIRAFGLAGLANAIWIYSIVLAFAATIGFLVLLTLRYRASAEAEARRRIALAAAALTIYAGFIGGFGLGEANVGILDPLERPVRWWGVASFVPMVAIGFVWLASMRGPDARLARNMAWLTFGMILIGLLMSAGDRRGGFGVVRILMTAMLAYAILKHQLLGIDLKLRWGISKSTIAAVFIAVFFIASEAAQQFFGDTLGSTYVGIAAAGGLVFAIAPLQRAAERLAEKAVPIAGAIAAGPTGGAEETFRVTLRKYLADGVVTREEEVHLSRLATRLGIDAERATALRHEMEDERVTRAG